MHHWHLLFALAVGAGCIWVGRSLRKTQAAERTKQD